MEFHEFDDGYLERLRAGDFRTQEHFVAYFGRLLQIKLKSRLRSPQDAEDARQETFERFFRQLRKENGIRDAKRLGAYVVSICNNVLLEHYRKRVPEPLEDPIANNIPDPGRSAVDFLLNDETKRIVREILEALPERDRRILGEVFLEERDKDKVCQEFGVTRDNLRVLVLRAKVKFREKMRKNPPRPKAGSEGKAAD